MKATALLKAEASVSSFRTPIVPTVDQIVVEERTSKLALACRVMVKETLGDDWLTPELSGFGASTLVNDLLMQIGKAVDGNYQGSNYFSLP